MDFLLCLISLQNTGLSLASISAYQASYFSIYSLRLRSYLGPIRQTFEIEEEKKGELKRL